VVSSVVSGPRGVQGMLIVPQSSRTNSSFQAQTIIGRACRSCAQAHWPSKSKSGGTIDIVIFATGNLDPRPDFVAVDAANTFFVRASSSDMRRDLSLPLAPSYLGAFVPSLVPAIRTP
jgi:hypothetical protein